MIIDRLDACKIYRKLNRRFSLAFDFIEGCKRKALIDGKYEIDGRKVFAIVQRYQTQPSDKLVWEAHRKYIDLQYIIKGSEKIGYGHINQMEAISEYIETDDYILFKGDGDYLVLNQEFFAIFFPHDCHKVRINPDGESVSVKKIVVKIYQGER